MDFEKIKAFYEAPRNSNWQGRKSNPAFGDQYWHERIELINLETETLDFDTSSGVDTALIGYACDAGVRRNLGREGAKEGPEAIKQRLAKLALHHSKRILDLGNIICHDDELESCQDALSSLVSHVLSLGLFPILVGGGHDIAFGHFEGIRRNLGNEKGKIGIINLDAHFDLRPVVGLGNSGTPFNQILSQYPELAGYMVLGIQRQSNVSELFSIAECFNVDYILADACNMANIGMIKERLYAFCDKHDYIYLTLDMDGFSSAFAPGVSAPSAVGFAPGFVQCIIGQLIKTAKLISMDIAELNPNYDIDSRTADLAARIIGSTIESR